MPYRNPTPVTVHNLQHAFWFKLHIVGDELDPLVTEQNLGLTAYLTRAVGEVIASTTAKRGSLWVLLTENAGVDEVFEEALTSVYSILTERQPMLRALSDTYDLALEITLLHGGTVASCFNSSSRHSFCRRWSNVA